MFFLCQFKPVRSGQGLQPAGGSGAGARAHRRGAGTGTGGGAGNAGAGGFGSDLLGSKKHTKNTPITAASL